MDSIKRICIVENPTMTHAKKDKPPQETRNHHYQKMGFPHIRIDSRISTLAFE